MPKYLLNSYAKIRGQGEGNKKIILESRGWCEGLACPNKDFVGLGSCDNVQTERSIFEYANWQSLQIKRTGPSS